MTLPLPKRELSQWRTWTGLLILAALMVLALFACRNSAQGPAILPPVIGGLSSLGLWLAGKSAVEHTANAKAAQTSGTPPPV